MFKTFLTLISLVSTATNLLSNEPSYLEECSLIEEIANLDWKTQGTYEIPEHHSIFSLPEEHLALINKDAKQFIKMCYKEMNVNESSSLDNLIIFSSDYYFDKVTSFEHYNVGYIPLNEWDNLDSQKLFESICKYTEQANKNLENTEIPKEYVIDWVEAPTLNKDNHTVHWVFETNDESGNARIQIIVIKLGRFGYTKISQSIEKSLHTSFDQAIDSLLQSYEFTSGARYLDFSEKDKVSTIDISSLAKTL